MTAESIIAVSAAVVTLTQLLKWAWLPDKFGPIAVLVLSLLGTIFWGWSHMAFSRANAFDFFTGFLAVTTSAAGFFGFTRATAQAISSTKAPPTGGAGDSFTVKTS